MPASWLSSYWRPQVKRTRHAVLPRGAKEGFVKEVSTQATLKTEKELPKQTGGEHLAQRCEERTSLGNVLPARCDTAGGVSMSNRGARGGEKQLTKEH